MQRIRRRLWTWAVSVLALCVILGAAVSGVFQLAVLALPSYRQDLSAWVTDVAGRPVQIGGVSLVWRGVHPRLDLSDITLYDDEGEEALSAERLSLGFNLLRLVTGDLIPNRAELEGLSLAVDVDEHGRLSVAGLETLPQGGTPRKGELVDALRRFKLLRLENCEVRLTHASLGRAPIQYTILRADLDRTADGFEAEGRLRLPASHGRFVDFSADIAGDVANPRAWTGDFSVDAEALQLQAWLAPWLAPGTRIGAQALAAHLDGHVASGRFETVTLKAESEALLVARNQQHASAKSMRLAAQASQEDDGWHAVIDELRLDGEDEARGSVHFSHGEGGALAIDAEAPFVKLDRLAPLLAFARDASAGMLAAARATGDLDDVVLRWRRADPPQYSVKASLRHVGLQHPRVGFAGLGAELSADQGGGRLKLDGAGLTLQLPQAIAEPVPFNQLSGEARWSRAVDGWRIAMPAFAWQAAGTAGNGRVALLLPDDPARSPDLDLAATFSSPDVTRAKPFIPLQWGPGLQAWLGRAIERGRAPRGELVIRGPLSEFPFEHGGGEWKLDIDAAGVRLGYLPDWPAVDDIAAHLAFRGNSLKIDASRATVMGNPVARASAAFADFRGRELTVDAEVSGETARFYQFLRASPLKKILAGLVNNTAATGPAGVTLHLDIPIAEAHQTRVAGRVDLQGVELQYKGLKAPIREVTGDIDFTEHGLTAQGLRAQFEDLVLSARIEPREGAAGVVIGEFLLIPQADGAGASSFIPAFIREALRGGSRWRGELPLGGGDSALVLASDLDGTAIMLPPPLAKASDAQAPIRITVGSDAGAPVRVRVAYDGQLSADVALATSASGELVTRAVSLQLGPDAAPPAQGEGIRLGGEVTDLDIGAWGGALKSLQAGGLLGALAVRDAELTAGHLVLAGQTLGPTHLRYAPQPDGWSLQLKGAGAEGQVDWSNAAGGKVVARLDHVALETHGPNAHPDEPAADRERARALDPAALPVVDVVCEHFLAGGADLGKLELRSSRIVAGQRLDLLRVAGGKLDADASGSWRRVDGKSSAEVRFELDSTDVAAVLHGFDYSPTLSAKTSHFSGELAWPPAAGGIEWELAAGRVALDVKNGVLKTVEPGAGRVLGLINFWALPRRLTLDFRDVVSSGLSFDKITGGFELGGGVANTSDLKIEAPSLRMEMKGRIGLVARDYDQQVTVYPDVSAGITLGAALLGGPALGALVLLAQQVLDKPLDQVTQLSYHLTGTWDNPKVEKLGGGKG